MRRAGRSAAPSSKRKYCVLAFRLYCWRQVPVNRLMLFGEIAAETRAPEIEQVMIAGVEGRENISEDRFRAGALPYPPPHRKSGAMRVSISTISISARFPAARLIYKGLFKAEQLTEFLSRLAGRALYIGNYRHFPSALFHQHCAGMASGTTLPHPRP